MDFLERFRQYLMVQDGQGEARRVLLAVSGGVDSMVMLHCFQAIGIKYAVAHCNFQLRGQESDGDEKFVREKAAELDVPFFTKRFDTKTYASENGISTQMAARELRYAWFEEVAAKNTCQQVATAHNLNDSIETALLNFIRGTGLQGLVGMRNAECGVRNTGVEQHNRPWPFEQPSETHSALRIPHSAILRPLLFATRDEIIAFAQANDISWREDSSNASDAYGRNFLRRHVMPKMQELNPNFLHTAERNLVRLRDTRENFEFLLRQFLGLPNEVLEEVSGSYSIDKQKLVQLPSPRQALYDLLKPHGFTEDQARQMAEKLDEVGFLLHSASGWAALCERAAVLVQSPTSDKQQIVAQTIQENDLMLRLDGGGTLFFMPAALGGSFPDGRESILVDAAKVQFPLSVRHWREGDAFHPFGMGGNSQKLQDFFTNLKLSRFEKEKVRLLLNGDGAVIWVIGHRLDERFRVGENTAKGLKISFL